MDSGLLEGGKGLQKESGGEELGKEAPQPWKWEGQTTQAVGRGDEDDWATLAVEGPDGRNCSAASAGEEAANSTARTAVSEGSTMAAAGKDVVPAEEADGLNQALVFQCLLVTLKDTEGAGNSPDL